MPKIDIKQETLDFLQGLVKEINKQDNRCTATPYYYVIQIVRLVEDCMNGEDYYFDEDGNHLGTKEEAIKDCMENYEQTYEEAENYVENDCRTLAMSYQKVIEQGPVFLTEKAINKHIEANRHHYGKTAQSYVDHFWRNPEMESLFKAIADISGIELEWH